jgi:hypothetical protein
MKKLDHLNSIKVIITPWDKGFSCGIINEQNNMTDEQFELCSTVARGMIYIAMNKPGKIFFAGVKGFSEDRKNRKEEEKEKKDNKIIDFLDHLKNKKSVN